MKNINFFTPVFFNEESQKSVKSCFLESVEGYFYLGGKCAYIIPDKVINGSQEVVLKPNVQNKFYRVVLIAAKILSYITVVMPIIMLLTKTLYRGSHKFHVSSQIQLQTSTLEIPITPEQSTAEYSSDEEETTEDENLDFAHDQKTSDSLKIIHENLTSIIDKQTIDGVNYYFSQDNHVVFSLEQNPGIIFKMKKNEEESCLSDCSMDQRLANIRKAREVCKIHHLWMLVIPNAERFELKDSQNITRVLIAEQKLDLDEDYEGHDRLPPKKKIQLINQLAQFIFHTGFSDVVKRNIPILKHDGFFKRLRIGLIDLEEMSSVYTGLFGGLQRTGLANLFNNREEVIKSIKNLVITPESEPIYQEVNKLEFNEYPNTKAQLVTFANKLASQIILKRRLESNAKEQLNRIFFISMNSPEFRDAFKLHKDNPSKKYANSDEYLADKVIGIVIKNLQNLKIIEKVTENNYHGIWIQIHPELDHALNIDHYQNISQA